MLTLIVGIISLIVLIGAAGNESWGTFWFCIIVTAVLLILINAAHIDTKAWINRQNYWAYGDTDWMRRRVRKRRTCLRKPDTYADTNPWIECPVCGVRMDTVNRHFKMEDGREVGIFRCPKCLMRKVLEN